MENPVVSASSEAAVVPVVANDTAAVKTTKAPKERLVEFDLLRGLAIIYIVLGHSVYGSGKGFPLLLENILRGGTGVFVFVSGFFFHRVFYSRFEYKSFMVKKWQNVAVPFLVISLVAALLQIAEHRWLLDESWAQALSNEWSIIQEGYVLFPHWYIPFIMLTFLCSPLHCRYIRLPVNWQLIILGLFTVAALWGHRGAHNGPVQSLVYFTPYYLVGILFSQHHAWFEAHRRGLIWASAIAAVASLVICTYVLPHVGNYQKPFFVYKGVDWQFIQKMAICLLLVFACKAWVGKPGTKHVMYLAAISFPIFFIHPFLAMGFSDIQLMFHRHAHFDIPASEPVWALGTSLFLVFYLTYGTVAVVELLKWLLKDKSRWFIGG
ncbi:acyltransferase family protein [Pokkaliibacter sp. CJK22405]|uniref:acyltransferase family protein n=1 Tax=Pokkaliibacter sp. CJK22405 TaxID=3384615 RepID=UPI003984FF7D